MQTGKSAPLNNGTTLPRRASKYDLEDQRVDAKLAEEGAVGARARPGRESTPAIASNAEPAKAERAPGDARSRGPCDSPPRTEEATKWRALPTARPVAGGHPDPGG